MIHRALVPVVLACVACSSRVPGGGGGPTGDDPPARIDDVAPLEGPYGTTVTVHGENLSGSVRAKDADGNTVMLSSTGGGSSFSFKYAFPAEGEMLFLESGGGPAVSLGAFTPRWTPGRSAPFDPSETVHASAALGDETVLLVSGSRGIGFFVFGTGEPRFVPASGITKLDSVAMRAQGAGIEAVVLGDGQLRHVSFDGRSATVTPYDLPQDPVLGVGDDGAGFVVVTLGPSGIERHRGAPPTLTPSGTFVPMPTLGDYRKVHAVTGNGTVIYAWDSVGGDILDERANFNMKGLPPNATTFGPTTTFASLDDDASELHISVAEGIARIDYCAIDQDAFDPKMRERCGAIFTTDGASKIDLGDSNIEEAKVHVAAGKPLYARCSAADEVKLGVSKDTEEVAIWPCVKIVSVTPSASGPRVVVATEGRLYAVRKR